MDSEMSQTKIIAALIHNSFLLSQDKTSALLTIDYTLNENISASSHRPMKLVPKTLQRVGQTDANNLP